MTAEMHKLIVTLVTCALACLISIPTSSEASGKRCRIGKASYCAKYGGFRCRRKNSAVEPIAACRAWSDACFYCHGLIPDCLKDETIYSDPKARCTACEDAWAQCMQWATARYFPNRMDATPLPAK